MDLEKKNHFFINCEFLNKSKVESKAITVGKSQAICNNLILKTKKIGPIIIFSTCEIILQQGKNNSTSKSTSELKEESYSTLLLFRVTYRHEQHHTQNICIGCQRKL